MATLFDAKPEAGPKVRGIEIIVPGTPIAQPRHRAMAQLATGDKLWAIAHRARTPQELRNLLKSCVSTQLFLPKDHPVKGYKRDIKSAAYRIFQGVPWECPVYLEILFLMPRPQNRIWKTKPMPRYPHTARPDKDNLEKAVKDSLTGVVYRDDSQVSAGKVSKWVCAGGENPKTIIKLSKIETT